MEFCYVNINILKSYRSADLYSSMVKNKILVNYKFQNLVLLLVFFTACLKWAKKLNKKNYVFFCLQ